MRVRPLLLLLLATQLGGCLRDEAAICAEKISKVEYSRRQAHADLFRARAECQAQAIEFAALDMNDNCQQTYQLVLANTRQALQVIETRSREPDYVACAKTRPRLLTDEQVQGLTLPR